MPILISVVLLRSWKSKVTGEGREGDRKREREREGYSKRDRKREKSIVRETDRQRDRKTGEGREINKRKRERYTS